MHVISKKRLKEFWEEHPEAEDPLRAWHKIVENSKWDNFADIRAVYPRADLVGKCIVFDIGGNKFRLIATVRLEYGRVYVRRIMTHVEYDANRWKEECLCAR